MARGQKKKFFICDTPSSLKTQKELLYIHLQVTFSEKGQTDGINRDDDDSGCFDDVNDELEFTRVFGVAEGFSFDERELVAMLKLDDFDELNIELFKTGVSKR